MIDAHILTRRTAYLFALTFLLIFASGCKNQAVSSDSNAANSNHTAAPKDTGFDARRAYTHVEKVVGFGPRPSGSVAIKKTQDYIIGELTSYGLKISEDNFTAQTPKGTMPMRNIIAELPGQKPEVVIISGHYDTKIMPNFVGANDAGSSTGALLETARVLAKSKPEYTLWFVFFDGEEAVVEWQGTDNTYGSRHFVQKRKADGSLKNIKAMINYDMIGDKGLDLRRDGNSTKWLVDLLWKTALQMGYNKHFLGNDTYMSDDHMHFVEAGIAAVDLIDFNFGANNSYWHTTQDTLDKVSGESMKVVADVVITALPEIFKQLDNKATGAAAQK